MISMPIHNDDMTTAKREVVEGFSWTRESWGRGLRADALARVAPHVFTTRDLALGAEDGPWIDVARSLGANTLIRLRQVHGDDVVVIRPGIEHPARAARAAADILITDDPSVVIAVQAADCVPLLIGDPVTHAVAAAHAGWRGLAAGVPARAIAAMADAFGSRARDLVAAIGPSIGPCCYEVGPELDDAFATAGFSDQQRRRWFTARNGSGASRLTLDLWATAIEQLETAGVEPSNISIARICTADEGSLFPSFRRDRERAGRLAGAIRSRGSNDSPPRS
jgi:YfiH family protein